VEEEDAPEPPPGPRNARGLRLSTVLTALMVAAGLALPGVAAFLLRPELPPPIAPAARTDSPGTLRESPSSTQASSTTGESPTLRASSTTKAPGTIGESPAPREATSPKGRSTIGTSPAPSAPAPTKRQDVARLDPPRTGHASELLPTHDFQEAELRALLDDPARPAGERSAAALELLDGQLIRGRSRSLARDAERIFRMDLPRHLGRLPAEQAGWHWVNALSVLGEKAKVSEAGEAFLRRFPDSALAPVVGTTVRSTEMVLASEQRARREMEDALRKREEKLAKERARLESRGEPTTRVSWELAREHCDRPAHDRFHDVSAVTCRAFLDAWAPGETQEERLAVRKARESEIIALVGLRRYTEARERLAAFRAADPEGEKETIAASIVATIPSGAEE
jgi:hypothetical protein